MIPGELLTDPGDLLLNPGRRTATVVVENASDRPIRHDRNRKICLCPEDSSSNPLKS